MLLYHIIVVDVLNTHPLLYANLNVKNPVTLHRDQAPTRINHKPGNATS